MPVLMFSILSPTRIQRNAVLERALFATPLGTPYNEDGSITEFPIPGSSSDPNPLADEQDGVYKNNTKAGRLMLTLILNGNR